MAQSQEEIQKQKEADEAKRREDEEAKRREDEEAKKKSDAELGEGGKRALEEERKARAKAEREAKAARDELEKLKQASEGESDKKIREAGDTARKEEREAWASRVVASEVRARAGTKLADPEDAVRLLDLDDFAVGDDGEVDRKKIDAAIDKLLEAKPYLAPDKGPKKPSGSADGGARKGDGGADEKLTPQQRMARGYAENAKK
jgi:hypothetical protein